MKKLFCFVLGLVFVVSVNASAKDIVDTSEINQVSRYVLDYADQREADGISREQIIEELTAAANIAAESGVASFSFENGKDKAIYFSLGVLCAGIIFCIWYFAGRGVVGTVDAEAQTTVRGHPMVTRSQSRTEQVRPRWQI